MQCLLDIYERMRELEGGHEGVSPKMARQLREAIRFLRDGTFVPPGNSDELRPPDSDAQDATQLQLVALYRHLLHIETAIHSNLQKAFSQKLARDRRKLLIGTEETGAGDELSEFKAKLEQLGYSDIVHRYLVEVPADPSTDAEVDPLQDSFTVAQEGNPSDIDGGSGGNSHDIPPGAGRIDRAVLLEDEARIEHMMDDLERILPNCSTSSQETALLGLNEGASSRAEPSRRYSWTYLFGFGTSATIPTGELASSGNLACKPGMSEVARQTETALIQLDVFRGMSRLLRQIILTLGEMHDESAEFALTKADIEQAEDAVGTAIAGGTAGGSHENAVVAVRRPCQVQSSSEPFAWPLCSALDRNCSTVQTFASTSAIFLAAVVNCARQGAHHVTHHGISTSHCAVDCLIDLLAPADYSRLHSILKQVNGHVHDSLKATNSFAEVRTETACRFVTESVVGGVLIHGGLRVACVAGDVVWFAAQSGTGAVRKLTGEPVEAAEELKVDEVSDLNVRSKETLVEPVAEAEQEGAESSGEGRGMPLDYCCVCLDRADHGQLCAWNPCGHTICKECGDAIVARAVVASQSPACPTCRRACFGLIRIFPS